MGGSVAAMHDDLVSAIDDLFGTLRADVENLIRIPSVSAPAFDPEPVRRSAERTAKLLEGAGMGGVRLLETPGSHPAVFGEIAAPPGAPTVLLYAHHDVQPPGPDSEWTTPPFEPSERDGRLYGRGSSDDKCGIVVHTGVVRAFEGRPPVGVKVFVEGEEETGSAHLPQFLAAHGDALSADVIVIADSANWGVGAPAVTISLRGLVSVEVEVRTLAAGVHSGMWGGAVPDALTVLSRVLASLHDADGNVAIPGLVSGEPTPIDIPEEELRAATGMLPGVSLIGRGSIASRLWTRPAVAVLAIDAPPLSEAINQLVAAARAKVSVRIAPGDDPESATALVIEHLSSQPAWGATVSVTPIESGKPISFDGHDPRADAFRHGMQVAWGVAPVEMGVGGSIPFVADFQAVYPDASILLTGVGDPTSRAHGPDESVHLDDLRRGMVAEAVALRALAG